MKKFFSMCLIILMAGSLFIGCGSSTKSSSTSKDSGKAAATDSSSSTSDSSDKSNDSNKDASSNNATDSCYGNWKITKFISATNSKVSTKSLSDKYVGKSITVSKDEIKTPDGSMKTPKFNKETLDEKAFSDKFKISMKDAKLSGDSVSDITVLNYSIKNTSNDKLGSNFIITKDNKAYTLIDGGLFELTK